MASNEENVTVSVVTDNSPVIINCSNKRSAEELCIYLCNKHNIPPLTRSLFALRVRGTNYFLKDNSDVLLGTRDYELRIRYMVPKLDVLLSPNENTFDYYFQQARNDINENKIPEIKYPEYKEQLLGLGITDMARAIKEENLTMNDVIRNRKKYIPRIILRKHGPFPMRRANMHLPAICSQGYGVRHYKKCYLEQLYILAPNYLAEEYEDVLWLNGDTAVSVKVIVAPFHKQYPGIRLYNSNSREWVHICTIEDLIYLMRKEDISLELSRKGTPLFFKFRSEEQLTSFISVCDGYYRLMLKWIFNLSKDDETPSLRELYKLKCHGPVKGVFSYGKLEVKRGKKHGSFILRQSQDEYNVFYVDVCNKNNSVDTYKIEYKGRCYTFQGEDYQSIDSIIKQHKDPEGQIFLNECLPPSEYDDYESQLLLCKKPEKQGVRIEHSELQEALKNNKSPRCLLNKDILLYTGSEKFGKGGLTMTCKAIWKLDETKKLIVAFKALQKDSYLKEFVTIASKFVHVQSSSIVRLYGITFNSPTALVLEYMPYGPLSDYLKKNRSSVKLLHLKKVAASLARALWELSEAGVVHGHVRCRRLLLASADRDRLSVKLAGPSVHTYTSADVHWMPVDFFGDMNMAKRSVIGDIWAFATTLWEVFSYGVSPTEINPVMTAKSYMMDNRLQRPERCPSEVWTLILQCWQSDPLRPQEIMRDMNHMLHREYVPTHEYEQPKLTSLLAHKDTVASDRYMAEQSDAGSNKSLISDHSASSMNGIIPRHFDNKFAMESLVNGNGDLELDMEFGGGLCWDADEVAGHPDHDKPWPMQSIESAQGTTYLVSWNKKIGGGSYGEVYKGWMCAEGDKNESQTVVAVKKLTHQKSGKNGSLYDDFENELKIMQSLKHENIVKILGYSLDHSSSEPSVFIVMEYLEESSLNNYLKFQREKLHIWHLLKYATDIATGMEYVASQKIVHRDLATRNILVLHMTHVKISDFGLARAISERDAYRVRTPRLLPINWYAPESATHPWLFSTKSDVWSYGVTAWEIFSRVRTEVPKFDVKRPTERAACFQIPDECPSEVFRALMTDCWTLKPESRPTFTDLRQRCLRFMDEYKQSS
ncbi:tyrosine-protein kinase hopscotch [Plodia interpunctella]|uniref:tyrosine-protein kinase hopscotch n=1 Tax=Plodia interpunctella TaxID=58824 RepID=UPI00236793D7|nr:tyrosine-protein kinase hopscotch [Plodia interpunctella]